MNLPINLKILLTGSLKHVSYGKKSVVDNIGPRITEFCNYGEKYVVDSIDQWSHPAEQDC
jgi:hypothetical protein